MKTIPLNLWAARVMILFALVGSSHACEPATPGTEAPDDLLRVGVSIAPQKYIIERLAAGDVRVQVLLPSDANPHAYEPGPEVLRRLSRAEIFFRQGLEFEAACLNRLHQLNPELRVIDLNSVLDSQTSEGEHGHAGHHDAHKHNPHTWLSPAFVARQSDLIRDALIALRPERTAAYQKAHADFRRETGRVDAYIRKRLAPVQGALVVVYHPSWEYFARDYGLRLLTVEADGHEPSPRDMMDLVKTAKAAGVRTVFAEPGFDRRAVEVVARDIGAQIELLDPLHADWEKNLCETADRIAEAVQSR